MFSSTALTNPAFRSVPTKLLLLALGERTAGDQPRRRGDGAGPAAHREARLLVGLEQELRQGGGGGRSGGRHHEKSCQAETTEHQAPLTAVTRRPATGDACLPPRFGPERVSRQLDAAGWLAAAGWPSDSSTSWERSSTRTSSCLSWARTASSSMIMQ